jgi:serine/threonine protein kinase
LFPDKQARLLREAQAIARVSHPNVIAVHDIGTRGPRAFFAMEFVEGETLARWLCSRASRSYGAYGLAEPSGPGKGLFCRSLA